MWQDYLLAAKEEKMLTQMTLNSRLNFNNKSWCGLGTGRLCEVSSDLRDQFEIFLLYSVELDCISLFGEILFNKWARGRWREGDNTPQDRILQSISLGIEVYDLTMSMYGSFQRPQKAKKRKCLNHHWLDTLFWL